MKRKNTLIFIRKNDVINWQEIQVWQPAVIIADKPGAELSTRYTGITIIQVKSVMQASWQFVTYYRNLFELPVVTITGTCGKTTTKEMLHHVLHQDMPVQISINSKMNRGSHYHTY